MKRHILVVDDDEQSVTMTKFILTHAGYVVKVAANGYDALEQVKIYKFDLVILDLNMPLINGFGFLERIRQIREGKEVSVLVLSVRDDQHSIAKAKKLGAEDYLVKPPKKEDLLKKVENILGGRPQFKELPIDRESDESAVAMTFQARIVSISEMGMVLDSTIALEPGRVLCGFENPIFSRLGIVSPKLQICECRKEKERFVLYVSFIDLSEHDIRALREWVIERTLKRA